VTPPTITEFHARSLNAGMLIPSDRFISFA